MTTKFNFPATFIFTLGFLGIILAGISEQTAIGQVTALKDIPDIITDQNDRITLTTWQSRLDTYRKGLQRIAEISISECNGQTKQVYDARNCPSRLRDLQHRKSLYEEDTVVYNTAVDLATKWAKDQTRPLTSGEQATKVDDILEALFYGSGDWVVSMEYLRDKVHAHPADHSAQAALDYVEGLYKRIMLNE